MTPDQIARVREIVACAREHHALRDTYVIDPLDIDALSALLAAVERMPTREQLRTIEWASDALSEAASTCPVCHAYAEDGTHASDCWIARALTEPTP